MMDALTGLLKHSNESVRKRASITLGPLVTVLDDTLFASLMQVLIGRLESSSTPGTYIQSISAICRSAGVKVGPYLPKIVPRLEKFCSSAGRVRNEDDEEDEAQLELWEQSLQALEAITLRCPNKVTPYVPNIVKLATQMSTYDPLYSYEAEDAHMEGAKKKKGGAAKAADPFGGEDGGDDWGEDADMAEGAGQPQQMHTHISARSHRGVASFVPQLMLLCGLLLRCCLSDAGGDGWDDDEAAAAAVATASSDNSWKVRRAAVGLLTAFIRARSDILKTYYNDICDHLVSRFKERDSVVKEEILLCTRDLLRESVVTGKSGAAAVTGHAGSSADADMDDAAPLPPTFSRTRSSYETLDIKLPQIVHACEKLFQARVDSRAQRAIFALLSELVRVRHGGLDDYLEALMPHILQNIANSKATKEAEAAADAIKLLQSIVELHKFDVLLAYLPDITKVLCDTVSSGLEQNKADCLSVIAAVAKLLAGKNQAELSQALYKVTFHEFTQQDVPLNIKRHNTTTQQHNTHACTTLESLRRIVSHSFSRCVVVLVSTISTLSSILSYNGEYLDRAAVSAQVMPVLVERLANDSTVQPTLRALTRIANLSDALDFGPLIAHSGEIIQLCRKNSHHIRNDSVRCMEALIRRSAASKAKRPSAATFSEAQLQVILQEIAPLLSDNDLHLTHLVLDLASTSLHIGSQAAQDLIPKLMLPQALRLMLSPRLQGVALSSLIRFLQACVASSNKEGVKASSPLHYTPLLAMLLQSVQGQSANALGKSAYLAIAQCVAGTTERASDAQANETVSKFVSEIVQQRDLNEQSQIALLVLGEIGRRRDLTSHAGLEAACIKAFDAKDEQVRSAAAFALGNISVGNLSKNLPTLLALIKQKLAINTPATSHHGYLLFSALKEIILSYSNDAAGLAEFKKYTDALLPLLLANVGHAHEATRAMVSECLGRLLVVDSAKLMLPLEKLVASPSADVRACIITALRFCLHPLMDYPALYQNMQNFLTPLLKVTPPHHTASHTLHTTRTQIAASPSPTLPPLVPSSCCGHCRVVCVRAAGCGSGGPSPDSPHDQRRGTCQHRGHPSRHTV